MSIFLSQFSKCNNSSDPYLLLSIRRRRNTTLHHFVPAHFPVTRIFHSSLNKNPFVIEVKEHYSTSLRFYSFSSNKDLPLQYQQNCLRNRGDNLILSRQRRIDFSSHSGDNLILSRQRRIDFSSHSGDNLILSRQRRIDFSSHSGDNLILSRQRRCQE
ncbi:hypothetical protein AVEN_150771-1 [Araneus ventricosus]|uniref:Uncharacterized protein n=1 Tax=Araneus ventricosus TaxID=182803 RepID=A0A4Y2TWD9_ARAVE|nr:hypothetical protein AVEN_150771-1 [Araneus ventricosus]